MTTVQKKTNECRIRKNDIIYTPKPLAIQMIEMCDITPDMKVLDPCYGGGVFYDNLPPCDKHWCELEKGKDFFSENERYDLVIGNPPYSKWNKWIEHTSKITDKFCYIFGFLNFTADRINHLNTLGFGVTKLSVVAVDYWFGQSIIAIFEKHKPSIINTLPRVFCEVCNVKCNRGTEGRSFNECSPKPEKKPRKSKNEAKIES